MARLAILDVDDAEAFVKTIAGRSRLDLRWDQREDLEQHLLIELWRLSLSYEPGRIRKGFPAYSTIALKREVVNWQRKTWGRTRWKSKDRVHVRELPKFTTLDDRPELPDTSCSLDAGSGGLSEVLGLDGPRDRGALPRERHVGDSPDQVAA